MPRPLNEVIAHIRAVSANPSISTTLIQTEDLEALCEAAERSVGHGGDTGHRPLPWHADHDGAEYTIYADNDWPLARVLGANGKEIADLIVRAVNKTGD
jgi:hypothetical protein